jgi:16S rRNA (cytidine1402-2'-O)-methyltransferase
MGIAIWMFYHKPLKEPLISLIIIVENDKTARKSIKEVNRKKQSELVLFTLNKRTKKNILISSNPYWKEKHGINEAGCPGVADPGCVIVKLAHEKGIQVVLCRPISHDGIWNERQFYGYLPIEKTKRERASKTLKKYLSNKINQIFIETPYRNNKLLEDLLQTLHPETTCVPISPNRIYPKKIAAWKRNY